jgi:hypothetical protein
MDATVQYGCVSGILTTQHPASHYGIPVLLIAEREYGPTDILLPRGDDLDWMFGSVQASKVVEAWGQQSERTAGERELARLFCVQQVC